MVKKMLTFFNYSNPSNWEKAKAFLIEHKYLPSYLAENHSELIQPELWQLSVHLASGVAVFVKKMILDNVNFVTAQLLTFVK